MTRPSDPAQRDPLQETEFVRKLLLGLMSTLESKGLMTETEIGVIVRAAQGAVYHTPPPAPVPEPAPIDSTEAPSTETPLTETQAAPASARARPPLLDFTLD